MHAIVRINTFDESRLRDAGAELRAFNRLHAAQPGYAGTLTVDLGFGRRLHVNLWESEVHAAAGLRVLAPEVQHMLEPLMAAPSQLIGTGPVVDMDLSAGR
jgi:hypothetical protein